MGTWVVLALVVLVTALVLIAWMVLRTYERSRHSTQVRAEFKAGRRVALSLELIPVDAGRDITASSQQLQRLNGQD